MGPHIMNNLIDYIIVIAAIQWRFPLQTIMFHFHGAIMDLNFKHPL